jgi:adenosylcobinamide-phosphate synthase
MSVLLATVLALALDRLLGEPPRWHPLVGFGRWAAALETFVRRRIGEGVGAGMLAWALAVLPWVGLVAALGRVHPFVEDALEVGCLALAVGARSLREHLEPVRDALAAGDLPRARARVAFLVSRDTAAMTGEDVARAATESALENGHDAVLAPLVWFALLGAPGVVLHRLANTLDAMWGYRTPRYERFGKCAARIDDALGWPSARITALLYALGGRTGTALRAWRRQAPRWDSPNAGPVMASGAGALGVTLGGEASYGGTRHERPLLGEGPAPGAPTVAAAMELVERAVWGWLLLLALLTLDGGAR